MTLQHWENKKAVKTYGYENQRTKLIGRMCQCILLIIIVYSMMLSYNPVHNCILIHYMQIKI